MLRDKASLIDIINAAKRIKKFTEGIDESILADNEEKQSAILYQVIIIGEATKRLSSDFREKYSHIPWKDMAGMRDILAHQYDRVNINTLWDVIQSDIPELLPMIETILSDFS
ncbi:HepT-like ribonuclease domain-containing protein [Crocosphaera watsonii]|uniref:DUF86 domain-containing protein n=4 Tax=Crocosphaera TaxID=263510 RepID=T2JW66_CROWT|nr:DUF86 domain-containing protein [Crocosphaera watsonii]EHJ09331.1 hypothetical protein CWATWH0003_B239 [Crocosphaera watsonii WH 0003]CCQ56445.1 hypothetical protein CWATWH0005_4490 [Crocosphaera watsonii WH 0005]CCQ69455.1 hypothetical protein CWATWH0402_6083 [Crocosphaera watsonii WH 0402]